MSRRHQENRAHAEALLRKFDAGGYPPQYPWIMEFLCKVKVERGCVNTANQQDTMDVLWRLFGGSAPRRKQ